MKTYRVNNSESEALEPEESLLEAVSPDSKIERPIKSGFFVFFYFAVSAIFIIFIVSGFNLVILKNDYFAQLSARNRFITIPILPQRGLIYSKEGNLLAENKETDSLLLLPSKMSGSVDELAAKLSEILNIPPESFSSLINNNLNNAFLLIADNITQEEKEKIALLSLPSLVISQSNTRVYPKGNIFSHLIGYASLVNEDDLVKNSSYRINDKIGRAGLEKYYEEELKGERGEISINRFEEETEVSEPARGNSLVLNIDSSLQEKIYAELSRALKEAGSKSGVAVATDPRDGRVLALVSLPSYDNNSFVKDLSQEDYKLLFENKNEPFFNRAISGRFAAGSTIKPLIALAALEEDVIAPEKKINAPGFITIPNPYNPEVIYTFRDWRNHGWVNLKEAIAYSSDIYFYTVGGGYYDVKGLGIEKLAKYFKMFKLDSILGIDLNGELAGFVPTPEWKRESKKEIWYQGDTFNVSIGQGDLLVTPLWLNAYIAAIGSGNLFRPFIADKVLDSKGNPIKLFQPEIVFELPFNKDNLKTVREGMKMAAEVGTAKVLSGLPFEVGAKSGTAEVIKGQSTNSWISVFAPYDNPQIALTIMMESGREGSYIPHQIAYQILKEYFK